MVAETDPGGVDVSGARALVLVRWVNISSEDEVREVLNWGYTSEVVTSNQDGTSSIVLPCPSS